MAWFLAQHGTTVLDDYQFGPSYEEEFEEEMASAALSSEPTWDVVAKSKTGKTYRFRSVKHTASKKKIVGEDKFLNHLLRTYGAWIPPSRVLHEALSLRSGLPTGFLSRCRVVDRRK